MTLEITASRTAYDLAAQARPDFLGSYPYSNNAVGEYCHRFRCFLPGVLSGMTVLDLGAGLEGRVAKGLNPYARRVVSLNPNWTRTEHLWPDLSTLPVMGTAQQLPFAGNIFDCILANLSVPKYLPHLRSHYVMAFREAHRVLAKNGIAAFATVHRNQMELTINALKQFLGRESYMFLASSNPTHKLLLVGKDREALSADLAQSIIHGHEDRNYFDREVRPKIVEFVCHETPPVFDPRREMGTYLGGAA